VGTHAQTLAAIVLAVACVSATLPQRAVAATPAPVQTKANPNELILCGWDEVFILDMSQSGNGRPKKVWSWWANGHPGVPWYQKDVSFGATAECKPVDGGANILITSSGSGVGVALVTRDTGKVLFHAVTENAHSADLLPGNRLAVATSGHEVGTPPINPDRLTIYDAKTPGKELYSTELPRGHGVVWDEARQTLWALSHRDLRAYRLAKWDSESPSLEMLFMLDLPVGGGHDLYPVPDSPLMTVSTYGHCWLFDRDKRSVQPHPQLEETGSVKGISINPVTGQLAYVQAEGDNWWAERVHLLQPDSVLYLPGERLYKARWNVQVR